MKYLKLFEKLDGKDILLDAMIEYEIVCELIRDFINFENVVFGDYETNVLDVPSILISNEDEKKLHEFIKNPELYKSTKKYNL